VSTFLVGGFDTSASALRLAGLQPLCGIAFSRITLEAAERCVYSCHGMHQGN
jgi:hypothetical protein